MSKFTEWVSESFIWGVGVTRPKPGSERFAARYITGLLLGAIAFLAVVFLAVVTHL